MTQRQRVNYAWWQTSRNRVVASPGKTAAVETLLVVLLVRQVARPGKTAAVGEATEQGKITPGLQWSCGDGPICQNVIPRRFLTPQKQLDFLS